MTYSGNPQDYSVAVVYGGSSGEREVSLNSGASCVAALREAGFSAELIDPSSKDDLARLLTESFDVAFLTLHGKGGEDGTIQGFLETIGMPYTGSGILSSAISVNKPLAKKYYETVELNVPPFIPIGKGDVLYDDDIQEIAETIGIPCVVKPSTEGSSLGMTIVRDASELRSAIETALSVDKEAMVEKFIEGIELTVGVIEGEYGPRPLPIIQIVPTQDEFYNYHAKYAEGGSTHLCPAPLPDDVTDNIGAMATLAHLALGCSGISRSDFMLDESGCCWILETNTLPGMTSTSLVPDAAKVAGIDFPALCEMLVADALNHEGEKNQPLA